MSTHSSSKGSPTEPSVTSSLPSKQIERLDNAISKLKDKGNSTESGDDSEEANDDPETIRRDSIRSRLMILDHNATDSPTLPTKFRTFDTRENFLTLSYLMWENNSNICWLDASMSLLVHNRSLRRLLSDGSPSQVGKIIKKYDEAILLLNDFPNPNNIEVRMQEAKGMLKEIQESSLKYLQPRLKYKDGEPDSAFCSLYNLIAESKLVKNFFEVDFTSVLECQKCNNHRASKHTKPIITLSKVTAFQPTTPISVCQCPVCKKPDQNLVLNYKTLPQCLIFHFESGAGKGELQSLDFTLNERRYRLTGVMVLEKSRDSDLNHFVTWIRDPDTDSWLECNDLNSDILSFSVVPPFIDLEEVYIVMYEASDSKGTTFSQPLTVSVDEKKDSEEDVAKSNASIPLIDLSDDETGSTSNIADMSKSSGCSVQKVELVETCEKNKNVDEKAPLTENPELDVGEKNSAEDEVKEHAILTKTEGSHPSVDIEMSIQIENDTRMPLEYAAILSATTKVDEIITEELFFRKNDFSGTPTILKDQHSYESSKFEKEEFSVNFSEESAAVKIQSRVGRSKSISSDGIDSESVAVAEWEEAASNELSNANFATESTSSSFLPRENRTVGSLDITVTKLTEKSKILKKKIKRLISGNLNKKSKAVAKQEATSNHLSNANFVTKGTSSQIFSGGNVAVEYPDITITRLTEKSTKQRSMADLFQTELDVVTNKDRHYSVSPIANQNKNIDSLADNTCVLESKTSHNRKIENKEKMEKLQENAGLLLNNSVNKLTDEFNENWVDESGSLARKVTLNSPNTILPAQQPSNTISKNAIEISNIHFRNNLELVVRNTIEQNNETLVVPKSQNVSKDVTIRRSSRKRKFTPKLVDNLRRNESNLLNSAIPEVSENTESTNVDISENNPLLTSVGHQRNGAERSFQKQNPPPGSSETTSQGIHAISQIRQASALSANQEKCFHASGPRPVSKLFRSDGSAQISPERSLLCNKDRNNLESEKKSTFNQQIETMVDIKESMKEEYLDLTLSQYRKRLQSLGFQLENPTNPKSFATLSDSKGETKNPNSRFLQIKSSAELSNKGVKNHQKTIQIANSTANQTPQEKLTVNKSVNDNPMSNEAEKSLKASQQTVEIPMKNSIYSSESASSLNYLESELTEKRKAEKESTCNMVSSSKITMKQLDNGETKSLGKMELAQVKYQVKDVRVALKKLDEETLMTELSRNTRKREYFKMLMEMKRKSSSKYDEIEINNCELSDSGKKLLSNEAIELQNTENKLDSVHMLVRPEKTKLESLQILMQQTKEVMNHKNVLKDEYSVVEPNPEKSKITEHSKVPTSQTVSMKDISDELNSVPFIYPQDPCGNMKIILSKVSTRSNPEVKFKNISNSALESNQEDSIEPNLDENPIPGSSQSVNQQPVRRKNQSALAALISCSAKKIKAPSVNPSLKNSVRKYSRIDCLPAMNSRIFAPEQQKTKLHAFKTSKQSVHVLSQGTKIPEMTDLFQTDKTIPNKPHSSEPLISKHISPKSESSMKLEAREVFSEVPPVGGRSETVNELLSQANSQFGVSVIVDGNLNSERTNLDTKSFVTWAPKQTTQEICGKSLTKSPQAKPNENLFPSGKESNCKQTPNSGFTYSSKAESDRIHASAKKNLESTSVTNANNKILKISLMQETNATSHKKVRFLSNECLDEITARPSETLAEVDHDVAMPVDDTKSKEIEDNFNIVQNPMKKRMFSENESKQEIHPDLINLIRSNANSFFSKTLDLKPKPGGIIGGSPISPKKKRKVMPTAIASNRKKHKANSASNVSSESNFNINVHLPSSDLSSRSSEHIPQTYTPSAESNYSDTDSSSQVVKTRKVKTKTRKESSKPQSCKPNCDCGSLDQVEIVQGMCELFYKELYTYFGFGGSK